MLVCSLSFASDEGRQIVTGTEDKDLPVINEELRKLQSTISSNSTAIAAQDYVTSIVWIINGDAEVATSKGKRVYVPFGGSITKSIAYAETAPTSADLIFDINKNGSTIWSTQANRIEIAASANEGTQTTFDTTSCAIGDYFTLDIDQIGSGNPGADITVQLYIEVDV